MFVDQVDKSKVAVQKPLDEAQLLFDSLMQKYFGYSGRYPEINTADLILHGRHHLSVNFTDSGVNKTERKERETRLKILYEDEQILVCIKPAGIATQTAQIGMPDMVSMIKNYLAQKKGERNPYLGVVHRLDQPVAGILVFGKTKEAAASLGRQLGTGEAGKEYLALCYGRIDQEEGKLVHYLKKDGRNQRAVITKEDDREGKKAELSYRVLKRGTGITLVAVSLLTGRFHQIRAQFLAYGHPLLGDRKYGTKESEEVSRNYGINQSALCASSLTFVYPDQGKREMKFTLDREDLPVWGNIEGLQ